MPELTDEELRLRPTGLDSSIGWTEKGNMVAQQHSAMEHFKAAELERVAETPPAAPEVSEERGASPQMTVSQETVIESTQKQDGIAIEGPDSGLQWAKDYMDSMSLEAHDQQPALERQIDVGEEVELEPSEAAQTGPAASAPQIESAGETRVYANDSLEWATTLNDEWSSRQQPEPSLEQQPQMDM